MFSVAFLFGYEYGDGTYGSVSWTKGESDLCHTLMSFFFKFIMINGNIQ